MFSLKVEKKRKTQTKKKKKKNPITYASFGVQDCIGLENSPDFYVPSSEMDASF